MKWGGKRQFAKPRDFQRNPFIIFGKPLAKGCFGGGVGVGIDGAGGGACGGVFIVVFVGVGRWGVAVMVGGDCVADVIRCGSGGGSVRVLVGGVARIAWIGIVEWGRWIRGSGPVFLV